MSGPERIWAIGNGKGGDWGTRNGLCHTFGGTEYVRADAVAEMIRQAVEALESWMELAAHCSIEEGVCCCGDDMKNHSVPMNCGHSPTDHGEYIAEMLVETTRATLAKIKRAHQ